MYDIVSGCIMGGSIVLIIYWQNRPDKDIRGAFIDVMDVFGEEEEYCWSYNFFLFVCRLFFTISTIPLVIIILCAYFLKEVFKFIFIRRIH